MYILNGRTLGDSYGMVDYFISSCSLSNEILSMNVHGISLFSDHCLISLKLKISFDNENDESFCEARSSLKYTHLPDKFLWSDKVKTEYQDAF